MTIPTLARPVKLSIFASVDLSIVQKYLQDSLGIKSKLLTVMVKG